MRQPHFRIVISQRSNNILVERQMQGAGDSWTTVQRYTTHDLTKELKRTDPWMHDVIKLCSQPSAELSIAIPDIPSLEESMYQRLNRTEKAYLALLMAEQHNAEMKQPTKAMAANA